MQLIKLTNQLRPLTIATCLMTTAKCFAYSDIDNFSQIMVTTSSRTAEYVNIVDKNDALLLSVEYRFQLYLNNWREKTQFMSSAYSIVNDEDFQSIVAMGKSVVPFIVKEIEREPSTLVWALNYIYGHKISDKSNITISEACKLWIKALS